jgi:predicted GIY-YIG superfamily endonuclease
MESSLEATYVLRLQDDKWYVGKSTRLNERLSQHFSGNGSKWTKMYPPISVEDVFSHNCEEEATLWYMNIHGVNNVRGYSWCQPVLSKYGLDNIHSKLYLYCL